MSSHYTDQPPPDDPRTARAARRRPDDYDDEAPQPLGSLAQKARGKQLNVARRILLAVGILYLIVNLIDLVQFHSQVTAPGVQVTDPTLVTLVYAIDSAFSPMSVMFIIFAIIIHHFPVPVTIISLVLFVLSTLILMGFMAVYNPSLIAAGWLWKILIIVGLAKSIQAAVAYEKERQQETYY
jgi:hypothetical protein